MKEAFESILTILLCLIAGVNILKLLEVRSHFLRCKFVVVRGHLKRVFGMVALLGLILIPENPQGWDFFTSLLLMCMAIEFTNALYE